MVIHMYKPPQTKNINGKFYKIAGSLYNQIKTKPEWESWAKKQREKHKDCVRIVKVNGGYVAYTRRCGWSPHRTR